MNIGIVTTWFERGAAYVSRQYMNILKKQHKIYIYARGGESYSKGDPEWDKKFVTWGKKTPIPIPTAIDLKEFKWWLNKNKIDIVFFNEQHWWHPVLLCNTLGIKTGAYIDYYTEDTVPLFGNYDFLICNTKRHYSVFSWHPQSFYIPWGTDINLFKPRSFKPVLEDRITFFHSVGMNPRRKGTDLVLRAFSFLNSNAHLVIHTQVDLEKKLPEMRPLIIRLQKEGKLKIYHQSFPAPGLYHLGDVYIYPTRLEGIGLTIIEAMACGLPVITSNNPPMNEFVRPDTNGKLVSITRLVARPDGYYWPQCYVDNDDLTLQMEWYINNIGKLPALKKQTRDYAENNFDWDKNASDIGTIFLKARKRSVEDIRIIAQKAVEFEKMRTTLQQRFPIVVRAGKSILEKLKFLF
jgi:1,2-diacylglycerol 3-alpha-glucosyltransferase